MGFPQRGELMQPGATETWAIDADGHVLEPPHALPDYIEPRFRERAPRIVERDGREYWAGDHWTLYTSVAAGGAPLPATALPGCAGIARWNAGSYSGQEMPPYSQAHPASFEPGARLAVMDRERFRAAFLYPTLSLAYIPDVAYQSALHRAYNDWLADYCSAAPERLYGVAAVNLVDPPAAAAELERCVRHHGFRAAFLRPCLYIEGTQWWDEVYEPFWNKCEELDVAVGFHPFSVDRMAGAGRHFRLFEPSPVESFLRAPFVHPVDSMFLVGSLICGGVLERHPRLRIAVLEASGGWLVPLLERLDHRFEHLGQTMSDRLRHKPSEYFRRQGWISFDPDEKTLELTARVLGADRIIIGSDFPHPDAFYPDFVDTLQRAIGGLELADRAQILGGAARALYKV
jgi:predicted TIM-barrel fold metal-dependent hydrolase